MAKRLFLSNVKDMDGNAPVLIQLIGRDNEVIGFTNDTVESLTTLSYVSKNYEMRDEKGSVNSRVLITFEWEAEPVADAAAAAAPVEEAKKSKSGKNKKSRKTPSPTQTSITTAPTDDFQRPKFLRVGYYYTTTKDVYGYTKSFRLISPLANFGESSVNYVLGKLGFEKIKSTTAIDQSVVPIIDTLDTKVDENLAAVCDLLVKSQNKLLHTKDVALDKLIETKDKTVTKITDVASTTADSITKAKNATVSTVSSASSATYQRVSGTAVYLISFVPIVGKRVGN